MNRHGSPLRCNGWRVVWRPAVVRSRRYAPADVPVPVLVHGAIAMLLPRAVMANSATDLHAYASMQPDRFNGVEFDPVGPALSMK